MTSKNIISISIGIVAVIIIIIIIIYLSMQLLGSTSPPNTPPIDTTPTVTPLTGGGLIAIPPTYTYTTDTPTDTPTPTPLNIPVPLPDPTPTPISLNIPIPLPDPDNDVTDFVGTTLDASIPRIKIIKAEYGTNGSYGDLTNFFSSKYNNLTSVTFPYSSSSFDYYNIDSKIKYKYSPTNNNNLNIDYKCDPIQHFNGSWRLTPKFNGTNVVIDCNKAS
jgi:hypothetical protein